MTAILIVIDAFGSHQKTGTETRGLGNKGTIRDHPNYRIVEIGQKGPGNLKRLAVA